MLKHTLSKSLSSFALKQEIIGGITNFMAIAYIIIANPIILNASGFPIAPSITATLITIIIMTTIAGLFVKLPFVIAPGMGINVMVSYTLVINDKLPINIALGIVFWSSLILLIFSVTPLRQKIITIIPKIIQRSLTVGIGLFLVLVGIKNANIIIANPNTLITINKININTILCFLGFILTSVLFIRKKIYAFILPILVVTIASFIINKQSLPKQLIALPDFSLFNQVDLINSFKLSLLPTILSLFIIIFFDATSSAIGLLSQIKTVEANYYKRSLITDALAGVVSAIAGTSPGTIFVESSAGIQSGAKTGIASIVTALLCIPFLLIWPIISIVPFTATTPILILIGIAGYY